MAAAQVVRLLHYCTQVWHTPPSIIALEKQKNAVSSKYQDQWVTTILTCDTYSRIIYQRRRTLSAKIDDHLDIVLAEFFSKTL